MKTLLVMCIVFTRHNPSCTPLCRTASSTSVVILMNSIFEGILKVRYLVRDFTGFSSSDENKFTVHCPNFSSRSGESHLESAQPADCGNDDGARSQPGCDAVRLDAADD